MSMGWVFALAGIGGLFCGLGVAAAIVLVGRESLERRRA